MSHFEEQLKDMKKIIKDMRAWYDEQGYPHEAFLPGADHVFLFYEGTRSQWYWTTIDDIDVYSDNWRDLFCRIRNDYKMTTHLFTVNNKTLSDIILGKIEFEKEHEDYV